MRISAAQRAENENRIRAAIDRLLRGEIPPGGKCDIKTLASEAAVDRTAFYGTRPYAHLRGEFERRLQALQQAGEIPDPREAQINRLKADNAKLKERLDQSEQTIDELTDFRTQALARLAAQHEEIVHLRAAADASNRVTRLPSPRTTVIGFFYALVRAQHGRPQNLDALHAKHEQLKAKTQALLEERDRLALQVQQFARVVQVLELENEQLRQSSTHPVIRPLPRR